MGDKQAKISMDAESEKALTKDKELSKVADTIEEINKLLDNNKAIKHALVITFVSTEESTGFINGRYNLNSTSSTTQFCLDFLSQLIAMDSKDNLEHSLSELKDMIANKEGDTDNE